MQTPSHTDAASPPTGKRRRVKIPRSIQRQFDQPRARRVVRLLWRQAAIAVGALILALGYTIFQVPLKLAAGGVTGLGIIINHFTALPVGGTYLVLNLPLLLLGYFYLGRFRFLLSTVLAVICFSFSADLFTHLLPQVSDRWPITEDPLLAAIYAGVLAGVGMGIIHRAGGTVGGTSVPARIIYERLGLPMSQSYLFTDSAIILTAGLVFNWEVALLAILTLVLGGIITDTVVEGVSQVRTATIVTKNPEDVRLAVLYQLRRGVSMWPIEGGYQRRARTMLFCTILRSRVVDLKYTIATVDPDAFIVIGVAQQVMGGYGKRLPASAIEHSTRSDCERC